MNKYIFFEKNNPKKNAIMIFPFLFFPFTFIPLLIDSGIIPTYYIGLTWLSIPIALLFGLSIRDSKKISQ